MKNLSKILLAAAIAAGLMAAAPARAEERYGYVRTLVGSAEISPSDQAAQAAEVNQPVLTGDRVSVGMRSRLELELSDLTIVRLDGGSRLVVARSAFSADADDRSTLLRLDEGDLQLVVTDDALGDELPRIDTSNVTLYVDQPGIYRVSTDGAGWTEITVRSGSLDVQTEAESRQLQAGEALRVEGAGWPRVSEFSAPAMDDFEAWGRALDGQVAQADTRYVSPQLRYSAASLNSYGNWVSVGSRWAWRPGSVAATWRPYWDGRWTYTPSGLTWVSYEPWGWSTYHYGSWDYAPGYGWVWYPGSIYSPAWVYWYWGPSYAAWCPSGYYARYRGGFGWNDFRYGVYGWAGGGWDGFLSWSFVPTRYFGRHDQRSYCHPGSYFRDRYGLREVPRGIITTDTRPITPNRWDRPEDALDALRRVPFDTRPSGRDIRDLPDVSAFVNRRPDLDPQVRTRIAALPPATDLSAARRIPVDRGSVRSQPGEPAGARAPRYQPPVQGSQPRIALPREEGQAPRSGARDATQPRIVVPRTETQPAPDRNRGWREGSPSPAGDSRPRIAVPRENDNPPPSTERRGWRQGTPEPNQPSTMPSSPRVITIDGSRQGWRAEATPSPVARPRTEPRQGWQPSPSPTARPGVETRQGWRSAEPTPRTTTVPDPRGEMPRRIYVQPGTPRPTPSQTPVVRQVIDGVRNAPARPSPYVTPQGSSARPESRREPPPPSVRSEGDRSAPAARSHSQDGRGQGRGTERRAEERKPPRRDRDH